MDKAKLQHFKGLLETYGKDFENTIHTMKENRSGEQDKYSPNELSNYDNHPADLGSELFQVEMHNALRVHEEHLLKEVHDALGRIEDGTYGKCAFCGKQIKEERLEAIPYTRLCMNCEQNKAVDPEILNKDRPVEERVLDAPMGRKYLNQREDDEHEGMDQFNDLMKYGSADSPQDLGGYEDYEEYYTNEIDRQGVVDRMDRISNEFYKRQLPD